MIVMRGNEYYEQHENSNGNSCYLNSSNISSRRTFASSATTAFAYQQKKGGRDKENSKEWQHGYHRKMQKYGSVSGFDTQQSKNVKT